MGNYKTSIAIEAIPGNPGYIATITGFLADPESDPVGMGATRLDAALNLASTALAHAHPCARLAVAAVLREELAATGGILGDDAMWRAGMTNAIRTVEGI